ncbi:recombinase family protein [Bradyrhizobium sp. 190]|uniref:recombinase family protein n=1 Tax=Bradyrhizobium sp. 190 TaxID=2782658 RepID=UPI001FF9D33F|nr:recombinase family protein [Bradyrhizobium sp. 190]MCK1516129.1 recombinase family protein [Bradyrhizobium sp. 190]
MTKKIRNAPGWLGLTDDRTEFVYLPDRAEVVRQIFQLSIGGLGGYTIAKLLNAKEVPAFGTSRKWDQSTIHNMLSSRATIGEYQRKQVIEGKECSVGEPVPNYYPAVIDKETFEAAQEARRENLSSRRGRKGLHITNVFAGLPTCLHCGSKVKLHNGPVKSLICKRILERETCLRFKWSYGNFETAFFAFLERSEISPEFRCQLQQLRAGIGRDDQGEIYQARVAIAQYIKSSVAKLTIAFAGSAIQAEERNGNIRPDHPNRYFVAELSDGTSHIGYPINLPKVESSWKFSSEALSKSLSLSPRQGMLTALLAERETLTFVAKTMGMTLSTARWHLREIFRKTNTHSQAELINLAHAICPPQSVAPEASR